MPARTAAIVPPELRALLVKEGVAIGGLSDTQRRLALAFVWAGLPAGPLSEREINEQLRSQLAAAARCLDTDHVELRRWLVDAGWLSRDGFGREYRRVAVAALPQASQAIGQVLDDMDTARLAHDCRAEHEARRVARRQAFEARAAGDAAPPAGPARGAW